MNSIKLLSIKVIPQSVRLALKSIKLILSGDYITLRHRVQHNKESASMLALYTLKQQVVEEHKNPLNKYELIIYSQNGEDGILFHIFSKIGTTNRQFVEFGIGDGKQCNTANLSINFGWRGLLIEIDEKRAAAARYYYRTKLPQSVDSVKVVNAKVTKDNINALLVENQIEHELDLLSIDIDGNDYWVWEAIDTVQPRVVVIEYNASFGDKKSITVIYDPNFDRFSKHPLGYYHGASLQALTNLATKKGYVLVGCDSTGTNAFFVRKDVAENKIEEISVTDSYFTSLSRTEYMTRDAQFAQVADMQFEEV